MSNRHCTTTIALWRFLLERLMTAQAFENVNIYILFSKTRYLKPAATRHQLRGSIVYSLQLISGPRIGSEPSYGRTKRDQKHILFDETRCRKSWILRYLAVKGHYRHIPSTIIMLLLLIFLSKFPRPRTYTRLVKTVDTGNHASCNKRT